MKKIDNIKNAIYYLPILIISLISLYFGLEYSTYHTDLIHFSVIFEQANSFISGQKLYKEIILQYGEGQPIIFYLINNFYKIDNYSIGAITSVIYSIRFFLVYKLSLYIIECRKTSLLCTFLIFISMTYTQVPWPDFYSGLSLILFFTILFFNYKKQDTSFIILASLFLFLTIFLRNTYILNFIISSIAYFLYEIIFFKNKSKYIHKIIYVTLIFIILYLFYLYLNDNLYLWFSHGIGISDSFLNSENKSIIERLNNYFYYIARIVFHLISPFYKIFNDNGVIISSNLFFSICFIINCIFLLFGKKLLKDNISNEKFLLISFISIYGLSGIIQTVSSYEVFRYMNACISTYIIAFYFIKNIKILTEKKFYLYVFTLSGIFIIHMISYMPTASHTFSIGMPNIIEKKQYNTANFKIFGKKKLTQDFLEYHETVKSMTCGKKHIFNLGYDRNLGLLCDDNRKDYYYSVIHENKKLLLDLKNGLNQKDRIIISHKKLAGFNLISKIKLPKYYRYTYSDTYMRFLSNMIYFYE